MKHREKTVLGTGTIFRPFVNYQLIFCFIRGLIQAGYDQLGFNLRGILSLYVLHRTCGCQMG